MDKIHELIKQIKKRPAMYLSSNYISCLKAFLDGWYIRDPDNVSDAHMMAEFQDWIEKRYKTKTSNSWSRIILFHSQDESDALDKFFDDYEEFYFEYEKTNKK